jgi:hypothetical protein
VEPVVDLAPGAEQDPLAQMFAGLVRDSVRDERTRREFDRLRASVGVVADDSGSALTLRFDFGRLTVHEGLVGIPTVTIRGMTSDIEALADLPFRGHSVRALTDREGRAALKTVIGALRKRRLKIYGLVLHARLVLRLLSVLSRRKPDGA